MNIRLTALVVIAVLTGTTVPPQAHGAWSLAMPDTLRVNDGLVTLGDLATGPVPTQARDLVIRAGLEPNTVASVSRQDVLRRLVTAGLARGVRITGPGSSLILCEGRKLTIPDLEKEVGKEIQHLVPSAWPGAPDSWFELELPVMDLSVVGNWVVERDRFEPMKPGRNLVRIRLVDGPRQEVFVAVATLHAFGEVGEIRREIPKNQALDEDMFLWEWRDLAEVNKALVVHRHDIEGCSSARILQAGKPLRKADLKKTPVIQAGDLVDLQVVRGRVSVTVRAVARQDGCLDQTIPVRNELTGKLVNALVVGPGLVKWRR